MQSRSLGSKEYPMSNNIIIIIIGMLGAFAVALLVYLRAGKSQQSAADKYMINESRSVTLDADGRPVVSKMMSKSPGSKH